MNYQNHIQSSSFAASTALNMKLFVILSVIAIGYGDKLDRTYLPPPNAATAGGSPGALTAPRTQPGPAFGQGLPSEPGTQPGSPRFTQAGTSGFGQGPSGITQPSSSIGFGSSNNGIPSGNGFSFPKAGAAGPVSSYDSAFESRIPSTSSGLTSPQSGSTQLGFGQPATKSYNEGFGQDASGPNVPEVYTSERAQASADRNAEILKYINENDGDSYRYSYETSNGISAEEAGEAINGVRAQGGYSYTGDDGIAYSVTYTADENGYQPQGEHLPTSPPIPEEILKSIEENARAAAAGTQEGAYRPEEYDSEPSSQQYNDEASNFNQFQGQDSAENFRSAQGQGQVRRPQDNQLSTSQDQGEQRRPSGPSGQFNGRTSADFDQTYQGEGQGANGYNYKRPQNNFASAGNGQDSSSQYRPQVNGNGQTGFTAGMFSKGSAKDSNQGALTPSFGSERQSEPSFGAPQTQYKTGLTQSNIPSNGNGNAGRASNPQYQSSFGSPQGSQYRPINQPIGSTGSSGQGYQYQPNTKQNTFGASNFPSQGNQNGYSKSQDSQNQYGSNVGLGKTASFADNKNIESSRPFGNVPQYQRNEKKPAFRTNAGPVQSTSQFSSDNQAFRPASSDSAGSRNSQTIQAPYQYNRPGQRFEAQPQRPSYKAGSQDTNGISNQGNQRDSEQFGGPRQPPSFSPEEGYKY